MISKKTAKKVEKKKEEPSTNNELDVGLTDIAFIMREDGSVVQHLGKGLLEKPMTPPQMIFMAANIRATNDRIFQESCLSWFSAEMRRREDERNEKQQT